MHPEELRDRLLAPLLQWTRIGRQSSELMTGSLAVIWQRSNALRRGVMLQQQHDWKEMGLMTKEKVTVPIEALVAMGRALHAEALQFVPASGQAALAVAGSAAALASGTALRTGQAALYRSLLDAAINGYQLWGRAATVAEAGLQPILRQVNGNAQRLGER
ncbi:MAG: hypothetical protein V5B32_10720 [Candidatus Accumulibacter sp. UW26]|jgi:hypothetical protein